MTSPFRRLERLARPTLLTARVATERTALWARSRAAPPRRRRALERAFHASTADHALALMGDMKGAVMKVGQVLSYVDAGLPGEYRDALADLQNNATPMGFDDVTTVIGEELGGDPDEVFGEFARTPLAAASIGQVHSARLPDGTPVAVKVQYPGAADAIKSDLENATTFVGTLRLLFRNLAVEPLIAELRSRVIEELDYRSEARNQQLFADYYRDDREIRIPEVFSEFSRRRVLTTALAGGSRWPQATSASQELRNRWGRAIYRFVFASLYGAGMFNGDPHPGNYLFQDDGSVTFLDFGCVKHFSPDAVEGLRVIEEAVLDCDAERLHDALLALHFLPPDDDASPQDVLEWFRFWYRPMSRDRAFTYSPEFAGEVMRRSFDPASEWGPVMRRFNVPAEYALLIRINMGLNSILGGLRATGEWSRLSRELATRT